MEKFCSILDDKTYFAYNILKEHKRMLPLTWEEDQAFNLVSIYHICNISFTDTSNMKVKDHCHLTGRYRGAAHSKCNLFIRKFALQKEHIDVLRKNQGKYIYFEK